MSTRAGRRPPAADPPAAADPVSTGKGVHEWSVRNFLERVAVKRELVRSGVFYVSLVGPNDPLGGGAPSHKFHVPFEATVNQQNQHVVVLVYARWGSFGLAGIKASVQVSLQSSKTAIAPHPMSLGKGPPKGCFYGGSVPKDKCVGLINSNGELQIVLRINVSTVPEVRREASPTSLSKTMAGLLDDKDTADLTLVCGEQEFSGHSLVLCMRSEVFRAMLAHDVTKESMTRKIEIADMDPGVLKAMLQFIYSDTCSNLEDMSEDLLAASDKYNIVELFSVCEKHLVRSMQVDNAVRRLVLGDRHRATNLFVAANNFTLFFLKEVMNTPGWSLLEKSHPDLVIALLKAGLQREWKKEA